MERKILMTLLAAAVPLFSVLLCSPGAAFAATGQAPQKALVAYFSWSGNTREAADLIHQRVGGDLFEIKVAEPYPAEYRACTEKAKQEQNDNARPALSTGVADIGAYDVVFIGYPNWWGTLPMALFTFLEQYDFSGKKIVPFCTHEGSGLGRSVQDIARLCPNATILDGLAIRGSGVKSAENNVATWLTGLGMTR